MQDDLARMEEIFGEALTRADATARAAYLDEACAGDAPLRERIEALLAAHESAGELFKFSNVEEDDSAARIRIGPGTTIGPYKLLEQIGEGGFGVVFMALQERPVRRKVALKIIKLGMDTKQVVARFEAERQALAMMDHPNIAKVFDAGATDDGRPYFVMELIPNILLTEYCDQQLVSIPRRLEMFIQICQATQHAHQKGIIHRDLKPGNVLVQLHDGQPIPKIIDFGVAKAIEGKLTERTLFTGFHQLIGTPVYMSPEQAQFGGVDIDTRSDIYSLGVLLYELLTGATPFDSSSLLEAAFDEMRRIIREVEPPTPSTRFSILDAQMQVNKAHARNCDPKRLRQLVHGDLDWIVMKCLEKDRNRRYPTANNLAQDVERYLADEPVLARAPSTAYRLRKLLSRNRFTFAAATALLMALVSGLAFSSWMYWNEKVARDRAVAAEKRADSAAEKSAREAMLLKEILAGVGPSSAFHDPRLLTEILAETDQRSDTATALNNVALALRDRGQFAEAEIVNRQALAMRKKLFGDEHLDVANSMNNLALVLRDQGKLAEAEMMDREGLAIARRLLGPSDPHVAMLLNNLGCVLQDERQFKEAEDLLRQSWTIRKQLLGDEHVDTAESLFHLASVVRDQNRLSDAEPLYRETLRNLRANATTEDGQLASTLTELASTLLAERNFVDAEQMARESLAIREKQRPDDWQTSSARMLLGEALLEQKKYAEAEALLLSAYKGMQSGLESIPVVDRRHVKEAVQRLVQLYDATGQTAKLAQWQNTLAELDKVQGERNATTQP